MIDDKPTLLIVDDEPYFRESLKLALEGTFVVEEAGSVKSAVESLRAHIPDAILLDVNLPDGSGIGLLEELRAFQPMPLVLVMTAFATIASAVKALKEGATDYIVKPFDIERLQRELAVHLENRTLQRRVVSLDREISRIAPPFVTTGSGGMKEIVEKAQLIATLDLPVLIKGDTGTGKEKLARWIHLLSGSKGELVSINCAALPKEIIESELFGYMKGAFSGAVSYKEGLVEKASGGTLFLDEIGELQETVQAKFLRVLEDGVYYKLGDTKERKAHFRLISATNRDLADPAAPFRRDLFYRINGVMFELPPLRERRDDIPLLAAAFIREANYAYKKEVKELSAQSKKSLLQYDWPGNIRELKWCINRAVALAPGEIAAIDDTELTVQTAQTPAGGGEIDYSLPLDAAIERLEKEYLLHALAAAGNNKTEAARVLGISVRALHYKIDKYGL
ncbi:sigma-54-dependent transcriptional regulator [Geobacter argillaceus]|uniref:Two-component system response regulator PilR (NtrC family)/two-component system response regulator AtoC n=1 Tax=Geobacter argillaceus TaxID=345631 RepID=A0A562VLK6_9BACT|nr:sigma-54 dependent transcriptional regulator [Geobacter argillaceus]TWJ18843.1 two-component system response regulator PilR (NtrC family)/two-component system response regulator AtoC [Geobacter argillaceus]